MALCSSQITLLTLLLTTQMIVTTPKKHSHTLSVRRHNQELSFAPAPRGLLRCIVVVGVLCGTGGWLRPPELALAHCYGYCWRPQQPVRPSHEGGREGGREGGLCNSKTKHRAARCQNHCCLEAIFVYKNLSYVCLSGRWDPYIFQKSEK